MTTLTNATTDLDKADRAMLRQIANAVRATRAAHNELISTDPTNADAIALRASRLATASAVESAIIKAAYATGATRRHEALTGAALAGDDDDLY